MGREEGWDRWNLKLYTNGNTIELSCCNNKKNALFCIFDIKKNRFKVKKGDFKGRKGSRRFWSMGH